MGCTLALRLHPETEDGNAAGGRTHHLPGSWPDVAPYLFGKSNWSAVLGFFRLEVMRGACLLVMMGKGGVTVDLCGF